MTKSYSLDLRRRVARFVEAGHSCHEAAWHFDVSVAFVVRLMAAYRATGSLAPKPEGGWRYSKLDPHRDFLIRRMTETNDITMPQLAAELLALHQGHARVDLALVPPPRLPLQKKRCGPANKDAPTCARRASTGTPSASRACARSRTGSSFSMRPAHPPR